MGGHVAVHVNMWKMDNSECKVCFFFLLQCTHVTTPYLLLLQNYMYISNVQWNPDTASVTCIKQSLL